MLREVFRFIHGPEPDFSACRFLVVSESGASPVWLLRGGHLSYSIRVACSATARHLASRRIHVCVTRIGVVVTLPLSHSVTTASPRTTAASL